jgi:hypothetical protein
MAWARVSMSDKARFSALLLSAKLILELLLAKLRFISEVKPTINFGFL